MPVSVYDILKESGFSDEAIADLDRTAINGFDKVLGTAASEHEAAEAARRSNSQFYESQIAPALNGWGSEKANLEAQLAFYRAQNESARASGFIPVDAPGYQPRDAGGRYVPNAGGTPGSPTFQPAELIKKAGDGLAMLSDVDWRHRSLFDGRPLPISPSQLIAEADARNLSPMQYAERRFGFDKRETELAEQKQKAHDDAIRKEATEARDRIWAEKIGNNPDIRQPQENARMTQISKATREGKPFGTDGVVLKDPLMLGENERRAQTRAGIRSELQEARE